MTPVFHKTLRPVSGANAERARQHNSRLVLNALRNARMTGDTAGRAEIARLSGLSIQAVSNIIADLEQQALIRSCGRRTQGRGQPAVQYEICADGAFALGFEVRPDALFCSLLNLNGETVCTNRAALNAASPETVGQAMLDTKATLMGRPELTEEKLLGSGIVMPGPFGNTGISGHDTELTGWQDLEITPWAEDLLQLPAMIENDANAAAMAERISGVTQGMHHYACLYFGAGLGLGVVSNGQVLHGARGNAGEIGHIRVPLPGGAQPLEAVLSRLALQAHLKAHSVQADSAEDIAAAFQAASPALTDWITLARSALCEAVNLIENLFDPSTIVLCGALPGEVLDALAEDLPLNPHSVATRSDRCHERVIRGGSGPMTAALGAAALVLNDAFTPQITT